MTDTGLCLHLHSGLLDGMIMPAAPGCCLTPWHHGRKPTQTSCCTLFLDADWRSGRRQFSSSDQPNCRPNHLTCKSRWFSSHQPTGKPCFFFSPTHSYTSLSGIMYPGFKSSPEEHVSKRLPSLLHFDPQPAALLDMRDESLKFIPASCPWPGLVAGTLLAVWHKGTAAV